MPRLYLIHTRQTPGAITADGSHVPPVSRPLSVTAARKILKAKRPHSPDCRRRELGLWDRSGNCERCDAFVKMGNYLDKLP